MNIFKTRGSPSLQSEKITVVASFYPLAEFAQHVGKEKVAVATIIPAGVEPHDFEPTLQNVLIIQKSAVFIYNGAGFEPWIEKLLPDMQKTDTIVVNVSKDLVLLQGDVEEGTIFDPHVWLDPVLAGKQVDAISKALINANPQNKTFYEANAEDYKKKLADLDADFQNGLKSCATRDVIVSHEAFGYLAKRYNFTILSITGIFPDEEPSPQKMAEIVEFAKKNTVEYIFFETLLHPRLSETIAKEIGAQTLVFNPLEGLTNEDIAQGKNYLSIQRQNLVNLKIALNCI